jgi:hypothetical protein
MHAALFLVMNMRDQHWLAALISLVAIAGVGRVTPLGRTD